MEAGSALVTDPRLGGPTAWSASDPSLDTTSSAIGPSDAMAIDLNAVAMSCFEDGRGNQACVYSRVGNSTGGPCAFLSDGSLVVTSYQAAPLTLQTAERVTFRSAVALTRFSAQGQALWRREWQRPAASFVRDVTRPAAVIVSSRDHIVWAGQDCTETSPYPAPELSDAPMAPSCLDAFVASVDALGQPLWQLGFGTSGSEESITDMEVAPNDGLYLAGRFRSPLSLGGLTPPSSALGDLFALELDVSGRARWGFTWGAPGNDWLVSIHLAADSSSVTALGVVGLASNPGFVTRIDHNGRPQWQMAVPYLLGSPAAAVDGTVYTQLRGRAISIAADQHMGSVQDPRYKTATRFEPTAAGTVIAAGADGDVVQELDKNLNVLRSFAFEPPQSVLGMGSVCVSPSGEVAISSAIEGWTDFGFLSEPIEVEPLQAFVLRLRNW